MEAAPQADDSATQRAGRRWLFASAEFDELGLELRVDGQPVALERKSLEVLRHLLYRAGEAVTKDELLESVWPGRIVVESSAAQCISKIREALGGDPQAVIKTIHGIGYRLVAPVRVEAARADAPDRLGLEPGDHPPSRPLWSLVERLGGGGQGEAWLVRHDKTREERVYKFAFDEGGLTAIKREITLSRLLRDTLGERTDLAHVLDWNLEEEPCFIELERSAEGNLETWAAARGGPGTIPLATRLAIVADIAEALAAAHSVGVLHKDLKPSNVLMAAGSDGIPRVKIADFGSGSVLDAGRLDQLGITRLGFTESRMRGEAPATALYLAPEVIKGQPATVKADVHALGIILYQIVIGDFRQPLAEGWEHQVDDPFLREDIALAVAGDPARRLGGTAELATRLRSLDERRLRRDAEHAERLRLEQEQAAANARAREAELAVARLRARRNGMLSALATLIVGLAMALSLYLDSRRARNEAAAAAASSQAVAEFLSRDMFAVVGTRPLRELTVAELLETASRTLAARPEVTPAAAAEIHAALGRAFWSMEMVEPAERHLDQALDTYERLKGHGSEQAVVTAGQLVDVKEGVGRLIETFPRLERVLEQGRERLGPGHPDVLQLRQQIAQGRFTLGDWSAAANELQDLLDELSAAGGASPQLTGMVEMRLGRVLTSLAQFDRAATVLSRARTRMAGVFGESHLAVAGVRALLGQTLVELMRYDEAARELDSAMATMRPWAVGDKSAYLISVQFFQSQLHLRQGRTEQAIAGLERTIATLETLGWIQRTDHTHEFRLWLSQAYLAADRVADAAAMAHRALQSAQATLGSRHPITQRIRAQLADIAVREHRAPQAREYLAAVDASALAPLSPTHPIVGEVRRAQGLLALLDGQRGQARAQLDEARRIFAAAYGTSHPLTRRAALELAGAEAAP